MRMYSSWADARVKPGVFVLALVLLWSPASAQAVDEVGQEDFAPSDVTAAVQGWVDALWSFYATGEPDLSEVATPAGLARLRDYDWRIRAAEAGEVRFLEEPVLVAASAREPWEVVDGQQVTFGADFTVDVAPYAETVTTGDEVVTEVVTGRQRRIANVTFMREPGSGRWLVDDVGVPADPDYVVGLPSPAEPRPCPGLTRKRSGADPFLAKPWCTADGDGRLLIHGGDSNARRAAEILVERAPCGPESSIAYLLFLGTPPGAPIGAYESGDFVRDPNGAMRGKTHAYRRDIKLPADAISTGITNGFATLWTSRSLGEEAIIVQVGQRYEKWPRTTFGCGPA